MSASYRGASGPSGHAGLQPAPRQPVSGIHIAQEPVLILLEQPSQEQLLLDQFRKLTVRLLNDILEPRVER